MRFAITEEPRKTWIRKFAWLPKIVLDENGRKTLLIFEPYEYMFVGNNEQRYRLPGCHREHIVRGCTQ